MKKIGLYFFLLIFTLANFTYLPVYQAQASETAPNVETPVITEIIQVGQYSNKPMVKGTSAVGEEVMIYVDGSFIDFATTNISENGLSIFSFESDVILEPGKHAVMAIAKDPTSLVLSAPSAETSIYIQPLPAPTIIAPASSAVIGDNKPTITGLTTSGSAVYFYIDGNFVGKTEKLFDPTGTANFSFKIASNLSMGEHIITAVAEDQYARVSDVSSAIKFKIESPLPAPTLLEPMVINGGATIIGLTKNDTKVNIFVDNKLVGTVSPKAHVSGTANFAFKLAQNLTKNTISVYTTAIDNKGKESIFSNSLSFSADTYKPVVTEKGVEEKITEEKKVVTSPQISVEPIVDPREKGATGTPKDSNKESQTDKNKVDDGAIKDLLEQISATATPATGAVDENKTQQGKLQTNLVVFILFLIAVIVWIFWVNRELIKERKDRVQDDRTKHDPK